MLLLASGAGKPSIFIAAALALPAAFAGQRVGNIVFKYVDVVFFRRMVYAILLLSGTVAILGTLR